MEGGIAILQIDPKKPPVDALMPDIRVDTADAEKRLRQFLQENIPQLLGIIRFYVVRTGLAQGETVQAVAADILYEAISEALAHVERFDPMTQPRAALHRFW